MMNPFLLKGLSLALLTGLVLHLRWLVIQQRVSRFVYIRLPGFWYRFFHPTLPTQLVLWRSDAEETLLTDEWLSPPAKDAPNIVLIVADDLGINDLHGGLGVSTPNIDTLRAQGVSFPQAYAGQATCAPARAAIFTGRSPTKIGFEFTPVPINLARAIGRFSRTHPYHPNRVLTENLAEMPSFHDMAIPRNVTMLPERLRALGYKNYLLGKWHLGSAEGSTPIDRGFHESLAFPMTLSKYYPANHPELVNAPVNAFFDEFLRENMPYTVSHNNAQPFEPDDYMTDYLTSRAVDLIRTRAEAVNRERSFFLALMYSGAHNPLQARRSDFEDPQIQLLADKTHRVYAAMVKAVDRGVGRVIDALRETALQENTLVIFTSDNGGAQYIGVPSTNKPFRGFKGTFFEGGLRVPLMMRWPQVLREGSQYEEVVTHVDLFATIAAAARGNIDTSGKLEESASESAFLDGVNLLPFINTKYLTNTKIEHAKGFSSLASQNFSQSHPHDRLYWRSGHYRVLRERGMKLQVLQRPDRVHWHDLHRDPLESNNLAVSLNISSFSHLEQLFDANFSFLLKEKGNEVNNGEHTLSNLMRHYAAMLREEKDHCAPLWQPVIEAAISVDKSSSEIILPDDEYVYFSN